MTTTDLKPGDIVQHPEHGYGVVLKNFPGVPTIYFADKHGYENTTRGFTGWESVETVRPGHVQVRVDDLDLSHWLNKPDDDNIWGESARVAIRAANAIAAQRAESTPPADEKPTSATVTLYCPDCGEAITREVRPVRMEFSRTPKWSLEFLRRPGAVGERSHACPPAQPDEPQEFGAKATVAQADGHIERWLNMHAPPQGRRGWLTWDARDTAGSTPGQSKWADWSEIIQRGTVTIGWDE